MRDKLASRLKVCYIPVYQTLLPHVQQQCCFISTELQAFLILHSLRLGCNLFGHTRAFCFCIAGQKQLKQIMQFDIYVIAAVSWK